MWTKIADNNPDKAADIISRQDFENKMFSVVFAEDPKTIYLAPRPTALDINLNELTKPISVKVWQLNN